MSIVKQIVKAISFKPNSFLLVSLIFIVLTGTHPALSQGNASPTLEKEKYFELLDLIFVEHESIKPNVSSFVKVRFTPSFLPESQITLIRTPERARIIYIRSSVNLYAAINELIKKKEAVSVEALLETVKIESVDYDLTLAEGDKWFEDLFVAIPATMRQINNERVKSLTSNSVLLILDGGFYDFSASHGLDKIRLELYDENPHKSNITGSYDLTRIVNLLRIDISKYSRRNDKDR